MQVGNGHVHGVLDAPGGEAGAGEDVHVLAGGDADVQVGVGAVLTLAADVGGVGRGVHDQADDAVIGVEEDGNQNVAVGAVTGGVHHGTGVGDLTAGHVGEDGGAVVLSQTGIGQVGGSVGLVEGQLRLAAFAAALLRGSQDAVGVKHGVDGLLDGGGGEAGAGDGDDGVLVITGHAHQLLLEVGAVLDGLGADALGLAVVNHLGAGDGAVGVDADHGADGAAEALGFGGEHPAGAVAGGLTGHDDGVEAGGVLHGGEGGALGQDLLLGGLLSGGHLRLDDGGGDDAGGGQGGGADGGNEDQHHDGLDQSPDLVLLLHAASPPTALRRSSFSMWGVRIFISRMA